VTGRVRKTRIVLQNGKRKINNPPPRVRAKKRTLVNRVGGNINHREKEKRGMLEKKITRPPLRKKPKEEKGRGPQTKLQV